LPKVTLWGTSFAKIGDEAQIVTTINLLRSVDLSAFLQNCHNHDRSVRKELGRRCKLIDDCKRLGLWETLEQISQCDLVISDRYHGVVFSILSAVPFLPVEASTFKTRDLLGEFRYPISVLDPLNEGSVEACLSNVELLLARRAEIQGLLRDARSRLLTRCSEIMRRCFGGLISCN